MSIIDSNISTVEKASRRIGRMTRRAPYVFIFLYTALAGYPIVLLLGYELRIAQLLAIAGLAAGLLVQTIVNVLKTSFTQRTWKLDESTQYATKTELELVLEDMKALEQRLGGEDQKHLEIAMADVSRLLSEVKNDNRLTDLSNIRDTIDAIEQKLKIFDSHYLSDGVREQLVGKVIAELMSREGRQVLDASVEAARQQTGVALQKMREQIDEAVREQEVNIGETANLIARRALEVTNARIAERLSAQEAMTQGSQTPERLRAAIDALASRGTSNLVLGMLLSVSGLAMLAYVLLGHIEAPLSIEQFIEIFVPRLSFVVFVELLAYFFLRLYKATLSEIKFFQNETTNAESKMLAARLAITASDSATLTPVIAEMMRTERNFVLSTGQTTVELEKLRIDTNATATLADFAARAVGLKTGLATGQANGAAKTKSD